MTAHSGCLAFEELASSGISAAGLEQYKFDRLLELRAVIDSLRAEQGDELLVDVRTSMERSLP
jgi:hypothetical protein